MDGRLLLLLTWMFLAASLASGCAETARIKTTPSGARVTINDRFIGISPVEYYADDQWPGSFRYTITREGYLPQEGLLRVRALPGRVTATVFTLGIFALFKRPVSLDDPQEFNLEPDPTRSANIRSSELTPGQRLDEAREQLQRGEISEKEYKRRQAEVLKEVGSQRGE